MQERKHSKYSPSRAEQFFACPGAPNLLARTPARPKDRYAFEGDMGHKVFETALMNGIWDAARAIDASEYGLGVLEEYLQNDPVRIKDFKVSINDALDYINILLDDIQIKYGDAHIFVETRVNPPIASSPDDAAGYCDVAIYSAKARHLWVIDYKHGVGIVKAVVGNKQVMQYAAGFLYDVTTPVDASLVDKVTLAIVQPRAFHAQGPIREIDMTPLELTDYLMDLDIAIEKCMAHDAPLIPGPQCDMCEARSTCPAAQMGALQIISPEMTEPKHIAAGLPEVTLIDTGRLGYIYQHLDMVRGWCKDVEKRIYELNMQGVSVPGTKLVAAKAEREWFGEEEDRVTKLAALIGCKKEDLYRKPQAMPITEVEKIVVEAFKERVGRKRKKQAAEEARQMFAYYTTKESSGKLTLVTADDSRPPANRAATAFNQVAGLTLPPQTT